MATINYRPDSRIVVPAGHTIKVCIRLPQTFVVAAPPGLEASPEGIVTPGIVAGLFTHDEGVAWPDSAGVTAANSYLSAGWPVCFAFEDFGSALACHARLMQDRTA